MFKNFKKSFYSQQNGIDVKEYIVYCYWTHVKTDDKFHERFMQFAKTMELEFLETVIITLLFLCKDYEN